MGRAKGWITSSCAGARVAGTDGNPGLTYIPAHTVNGKPFSQRVTFTVYVNSNKGTGRDGTPGRSDRFQFVAYGALADSLCRSMSNGKAIDAVLKPHSYQGRSFNNGVMRLEADGSPVIEEKVGFQIVESPTYGEDAQKTIDQEIATGRRPANWNVANHPDNATWTQMLRDRANVQYIPGNPTFGYARVIVPQGAGIVMVTQTATGPAAKAAATAARAGNTQLPAATGTYVPPATGTYVPPAGTSVPLAITQEQLALLVAQVTGQQAGAGKTPPATNTPAQGIDPKTGFPIGTEVAGAAGASNVPSAF